MVAESIAKGDADEEAAESRSRQRQRGQQGPVKSQTRLRDIVRGADRRRFDRDLLRPCGFCKRRGHEWRTCMIHPQFEDDEEGATELQRAKAQFVKSLRERTTRQQPDFGPKGQERR
jgi:hypothetical protein